MPHIEPFCFQWKAWAKRKKFFNKGPPSACASSYYFPLAVNNYLFLIPYNDNIHSPLTWRHHYEAKKVDIKAGLKFFPIAQHPSTVTGAAGHHGVCAVLNVGLEHKPEQDPVTIHHHDMVANNAPVARKIHKLANRSHAESVSRSMIGRVERTPL